jgi:hypothetical protein
MDSLERKAIEDGATTSAVKLAISAIGTIIGRKTRVAGKQYKQMLIYVPSILYQDSQWPFKAGEPVELTIDINESSVLVKRVSESEAKAKGWAKRERNKK